MTQIFLKLNSLFLIYVLLSKAHFFMAESVNRAEFVGFATPFSFIKPLSDSFYPLFFIISVGFMVATLFLSHRWLRVFATILFLVVMSFTFSYGKGYHSAHIWFLSSVFACFLSVSQTLISQPNILFIRLTQASLLSFYFSAGVWKLRDMGLGPLDLAFRDHLAYAVAEGTGPGANAQVILMALPSWLLSLGFFIVVSFQLSCIFPVIKLQYFKIWGVAAFLFHLLTGVFLGVWFVPTMLAALFLLIVTEDLLKIERLSPSTLADSI